jgi:TolB protein
VQNLDGSGMRQLTNDVAGDSWPVWSPDGQTIVFNSMREAGPETWQVPAEGGPASKVIDGNFRGDWISKPGAFGTWLVSGLGGHVRLLDVERRTIVWERPGASGSGMPMFSPDARAISTLAGQGRDRGVWIMDTTTGEPRTAVRFPADFNAEFRASWIDGGKALLVTRHVDVSHIVMFDRFWLAEGTR